MKNPEEFFKNMTYVEKVAHKHILDLIHKKTLMRFVYKSDQIVWGVKEHWETYDQIPDTGTIVGDCDCFAMACRKECRKVDIPSRLVYCLVHLDDDDCIGHLVLESNGWILENRSDKVMKNTDLKYEWMKISGYNRNDPWHVINHDPKLWSYFTVG